MRYVLVGNGAAALAAATVLIEKAPGAQIEIYGEEPYWAYRRPQIPEFMAGEVKLDQILSHPASWYEQHGIAVFRDTRVEAVDPQSGTIRLVDGRTAGYDRLLLCTGSYSFVPPISGVENAGVFTLRTVDDALTIRRYAETHRQAIVIGGGLLGLEAARGLRVLGCEVTVLEMFGWLLPRQLDPQGAAILTRQSEALGIHVITGAATECLLGNDGLSGLRLKDGRELEANVVLISAGTRPQVDLAKKTGLNVNRGVVVDHHLQTSVEGIYAAGDVTEYEGRVYGIIPAAWEQARAAAANMAGEETLYNGTTPSTTLKVVGIDLTSIGVVNPEGEGYTELRHGEAAQGRYVKLVLKDGHLVGAILLGERRRVGAFNRLVSEKADVSAYAEKLLDPNFTPPAQ